MKTLTVTVMFAILATALILPAIPQANAATIEDGRSQLSPKAFGIKTKIINGEDQFKNTDSSHKGKFDIIKKEQFKTFKKAGEYYKALQFMKTYYRL